MRYKQFFTCVAMFVMLCCIVGCKSEDVPKKPAKSNPSMIPATLTGGKTKLLIDLPFEVKNPPVDEVGGIPSELEGIMLKAQRYQAGNAKIFMNASFSTFKEGLFDNLSEQEIYDALNEELQDNINTLNNNGQFSNLQISQSRTKIDNNFAIIALATYNYQNKNCKSTMVYTLHGQDFWRLIFDYMEADKESGRMVDRSVKSIKFK